MTTHRSKVFSRYNLDKKKSYSVQDLADITGYKESDLQEVGRRGAGAWKTNIKSVRMKGSYKKNVDAPRSSKLSKEQWATARIFAFINKIDEIKDGSRKKMNQDTDLAKDYLKK